METFGAELQRLRGNLSLRKLAYLTNVSKTHISDLETGKRSPSEQVAVALDKALSADGELVTAFLSTTMPRREFIADSLMLGFAEIPIFGNGRPAIQRISPDLIEAVRQKFSHLRNLDHFLGGADTYRMYMAELELTTRLANDATYTDATGRVLLALISEQAQQAGWAAFDAGWHQSARRLFKKSLSAAVDSGNTSLLANSLAFLAYQKVSTGHPGIDEAEASCRVAGTEVTPTVRALLLERAAWAYACAGRDYERQAEEAIERSTQALVGSAQTESPDWANWVDSVEIQIMTGRCWTALKRPDKAIPVLEAALSQFDDTHARDKALYSTWLAEAYLDNGDIDQATTVLNEILSISAEVASIRPRQRVISILSRLRDHKAIPGVVEVFDRLAMPSSAQSIPGKEPSLLQAS
ncbi:helix-turn-helix domain-containing protein [Herbidospora sp. RD11066]